MKVVHSAQATQARMLNVHNNSVSRFEATSSQLKLPLKYYYYPVDISNSIFLFPCRAISHDVARVVIAQVLLHGWNYTRYPSNYGVL